MEKNRSSLMFVVGLWFIYFASYLWLKNANLLFYAGFLSLMGQAGLDLIILCAFLKLSLLADGRTKKTYVLLSLAFGFAFLADSFYNYFVNMLQERSFSNLVDSLFDVPFVGFLIFLLIAWEMIFSSSIKRYKILNYPIIMSLISLVVSTIFILSFNWKINTFSLSGIYQLIDTIAEIFSFIIIIFCVAASQDRAVRLMAIGFLIVISSDFIIRTNVIENQLINNSILESIWVLGLMLIAYGAHHIKKIYNNDWLYASDNLQFQCALWMFFYCTAVLVTFLIIEYFLSINSSLMFQDNVGKVPFILIILFIPTALISNLFTNKILGPLKNIEKTINMFLVDENKQISCEMNIKEFEVLNNFIKNAFQAMIDKTQTEKALLNLASQVAHDIRSPLAALSMIVGHAKQLPEQQRIVIRNAIQQINDIANNMLSMRQAKEKWQGGSSAHSEVMQSASLFILLDNVLSAKRAQFSENDLDIQFKTVNDAYGLFARVDQIELKRVISNLVNNAAEAMRHKGVIVITLKKSADNLQVIIQDHGCGMSSDLLKKALEGGMSFGKENGYGLGLASSKSKIESWQGKFEISSKPNEGTVVTITLPISDAPPWFQSALNINEDDTLVVLDDDRSIHDIWETRIREELKLTNKIEIIHFNCPEIFLNYDHSRIDKPYYLLDYELLGSSLTGLDIIEKKKIVKNATLVTSRYDDPFVSERCEKLSCKILPKNYAPYVPIVITFKPDLILIDDDPLMRQAWEIASDYHGKKILTFSGAEEASKFIFTLDRMMPIYIDSHLSSSEKGENFAKQLYDAGFINLYLTTGYSRDQFKTPFPWIKQILGKDFPLVVGGTTVRG